MSQFIATLSPASEVLAGIMSAADKTKLDQAPAACHIVHASGTQTAYPASADTNVARGAALLAAVAALASGEKLVLGPGMFDLGSTSSSKISLPASTELIGAGMGLTVIQSSFVSSSSVLFVVSFASGCYIADLTVKAAAAASGAFVYPIGDGNATVTGVTLRSVQTFGDTDGLYTVGDSQILCLGCDFHSAWDCVEAGGSGGGGARIVCIGCNCTSTGPSVEGNGLYSVLNAAFGGQIYFIGGLITASNTAAVTNDGVLNANFGGSSHLSLVYFLNSTLINLSPSNTYDLYTGSNGQGGQIYIGAGSNINTSNVSGTAGRANFAFLNAAPSLSAIESVTQSANAVLAGPASGSAAASSFRALVAADIPNIAESQVTGLTTDLAAKSPLAGSASIVTVGTITAGVWNGTALAAANIGSLPASQITSGQLGLAQGGTGTDLSAAGGTGQILKQSTAGGAITSAALLAADIPPLAASAITSGTLATGRIPSLPASQITSGQLVVGQGGTGANFSTQGPGLVGQSAHGGALASFTALPAQTLAPSTAGFGFQYKVGGTYNPTITSGGAVYSGLGIVHTINGTSTGGKAAGLAIASITNTLSGGSIYLIDAGTTTTDYWTGYTSFFTVDVAGNLIAAGSIISPHHLGSGSAPAITAGTGAGTSPAISLSGTDAGGRISITTGSSPSTSADACTVSFNTAFGATPNVVISPANAAAAALSGTGAIYLNGQSASQFKLTVGPTALAASTTYLWNFVVVG
jgi:hypothetical protein